MSFLYDHLGKRKYLTIDERQMFLKAGRKAVPEIYTFCATLAYTGARISEVLALGPDRFDFTDNIVVLPCLKKRRHGVNRAVPVPYNFLCELDEVHQIRRRQQATGSELQRIWPWSRTTAWKHVKCAMAAAGLSGPNASPKGLRHSFGVNALQAQTPITMVQKWLGHSRISTTAIYADAIGDEERSIAERFWNTFN